MIAFPALLLLGSLRSSEARPDLHSHWSPHDGIRLQQACSFVDRVTVHLDEFAPSTTAECINLPGKPGARYCLFSDIVFSLEFPKGISRKKYLDLDKASSNYTGYSGNLLNLRDDLHHCKVSRKCDVYIGLTPKSAWKPGEDAAQFVKDKYLDTNGIHFTNVDVTISPDFDDGMYLDKFVSFLKFVTGSSPTVTWLCPKPHEDTLVSALLHFPYSYSYPLEGLPKCYTLESPDYDFIDFLDEKPRYLLIHTEFSESAIRQINNVSCHLKEHGFAGAVLTNLTGTTAEVGFYGGLAREALHKGCD